MWIALQRVAGATPEIFGTTVQARHKEPTPIETILGPDIAGYQCKVYDEVGGIIDKGVFAKQDIEKGTVLCEHTGRLNPLDPAVPPCDNLYTWHVIRTCQIDSVVCGNMGRFVNNHCTQ
ncbi:hypothetical protein N0V93_007394 [Gnomoniopsis smithogilvyi]|uniref:Uncharacterized protein n=1 Tax=Gnomoniopsis smithogilvyi TaxID=1191159 RepID=A0A9W8YPZ4_9PEZI|nr:hypothetical protein N0V93_007394 [Gnomoniopsis smithogilvyi]